VVQRGPGSKRGDSTGISRSRRGESPPPTEIFSRLDCTAVHCHISRDSANLRGAMPGLKRGSLGQKSPSPAERTIRFPIEFFHDWTVASGYCSAIPLKSHYG